MALPNSSLAFTSQVLKNHEDLVWSSLPRIRMRLPVMSCLVLLEQTVQTRNSVQETSFFLWINAFDGAPQKFGPILMYPTIRKENLFPTNHHPAIPCYTMLYPAPLKGGPKKIHLLFRYGWCFWSHVFWPLLEKQAFFCSSMLPRTFSNSGESSGKDSRRHPRRPRGFDDGNITGVQVRRAKLHSASQS